MVDQECVNPPLFVLMVFGSVSMVSGTPILDGVISYTALLCAASRSAHCCSLAAAIEGDALLGLSMVVSGR